MLHSIVVWTMQYDLCNPYHVGCVIEEEAVSLLKLCVLSDKFGILHAGNYC